jgi:hypothetical protein
MNPDWKDEYNGHLWLCSLNNMSCINNISPILNRAVIFSTTNLSIHGHPIPLNIPNNITRQSIAVYYYTISHKDNYHDEIIPTIWYNENEFNKLLATVPVQINIYNNDIETIKIININFYKNENIKNKVDDVCLKYNLDNNNCQILLNYCENNINNNNNNEE